MATADEMYRDGISVRQIAIRVGQTELMVMAELDRLGITIRTRSEVAEMGHLQLKYNKILKEQSNENRY